MIICNLGVLMAERKLSIQDVADNTTLSRTTISALVNENGKGIQFETMDALCKLLNVTPGELFIYLELEMDFSIVSKHVNDDSVNEPFGNFERNFDFHITAKISCGEKSFNDNFCMKISLLLSEKSGTVTRTSFKEDGNKLTNFMRSIPSQPYRIIKDFLREKVYAEFKETYNIEIPKKHIKNANSII